MANGFETYVVAGIEKKKVPVTIVTDPDKADYELSGVSDSDRAGWAKVLFLGSQQTNEAASINREPEDGEHRLCLLREQAQLLQG